MTVQRQWRLLRQWKRYGWTEMNKNNYEPIRPKIDLNISPVENVVIPKYFMQVEQSATYPDSTCEVFYADKPFNSENEAKRAALSKMGESDYGNFVAVWKCEDNVLTEIMRYWRHDLTWTDLRAVHDAT
jgi:hypothetical protein